MDDYLALSLIIMGIAIGALLVIWGAMSLAFSSERSTAQRSFRSGSPSAKPQKQNTALNSSRKNRIPRMITEKAARIWAAFCTSKRHGCSSSWASFAFIS